MHRCLLVLFLLLGALLPTQAGLNAKTEEVIAEGLVLLSAEFGLIEKGEDGAVKFKPTAKVPLVPGQMYGWRLRLRTTRESVALREELELPVAPKAWGHALEGDGFKVSPDGRTGITEVDALPEDGVLMNAWSVAEGDPTGVHILRLSLAGKLVRTFKFEVVPK